MTPRLTVHTLGQLTILLDGQPVTDLSSRTAEAMLIYLMRQKRPLSRQVLADFFWDDRSPERAAANLRTLLVMLRKSLGDFLIITRQTVAFDHSADAWLDVTHLEEELTQLAPDLDCANVDPETATRLRAALDLYQGDFLEGFYLSESHGFEEWTLLNQERLRRQVSVGLRRLVTTCMDEGNYLAGIEYAGRLLAVDSYAEEAHRQMMWLLARSGQRNAALAHYQSCRRLLDEELGVEPAIATTAVYERIAALDFPPPCKVPAQPTPFVGRDSELAQIGQHLLDPHCRLLTILGVGGIGKTRLAIQAAIHLHQQRPGAFLNGLYYVSLAAVDSANLLLMAIAEALTLPFEGMRAPQEQLLNYLRDKELLLALDNMEALLVDAKGLDFIATLLTQAPQVKILVTSRERLNLHEEWLFDVEGLAYPAEEEKAVEVWQQYAAVQLFVQCASRVKRSFTPNAEDRTAIVRICQLLAGMPLGLEMAAAWVRQQSCADIAAQIAHDLDFLATSLHNMPPRHRSLRAIFEHSWQLLSAEEQTALCQLAIFQERIAPEAAQVVAETPPSLLAALAAKSLLRRADGDGGVAMHEMIRFYALEKLSAVPQRVEATDRRYCQYYAEFLDARSEPLKGEGQQDALHEIGDEIENIRAAWAKALLARRWDALAQMLNAFHWYHWQRGYFGEGRAALASAMAALAEDREPNSLLLARVQYRLAEVHSWMSTYAEAVPLLDASIPILRDAEEWSELGWALDTLGQLAYAQGDYSAARQHAQEALHAFERGEDEAGMAQSLTTLANLRCDAEADYEGARPLYEQSLALYRQLGDRYGQAKGIINLGTLVHSLGQHESARPYYEEGIALCRQLGHRQPLAIALNNLGQVVDHLGHPGEAAAILAESVALRREIGDLRGLVLTLLSLGNVTARQGQRRQAKQHYAEAARIALQLGSKALLADWLIGLGDLLAQWGEVAQAAKLATVVAGDAEGEEVRQKALSLLTHLDVQDRKASAAGRSQARGLGTMAAADEMLHWLWG